MKTTIYIFFAFLITAHAAIGQTGFRGRILDDKNMGVPYATVYIESVQQGTSSNNEGYFEMSIETGTYTVTISSVGYVTRNIDVRVENVMTEIGEIMLNYENAIVDEVVVSASRRLEKITQSPATIDLINATQFEHFAGSPEELFALQKGIDFSRTGNFWGTISIRGFNSAFNQKILMLDDNRISHVRIRTPVGPMSAFVKEDVERVEIVLGPSSALYGPNSLNALFNTISKSPFTYPGTTVVVGTGSYNLFNARIRHANAFSNKWAYKITSEYISGKEHSFTDSVYVPGFTSGKPEVGLNRNVTFLKLLAAGFYKPTKSSEVGINYAFNRNNSVNGAKNNLKDWDNSSLQFTYKSPHFFAQFYKTWIKLGNSIGTYARSLNYYALLAQGQSEDQAFINSLNGPRQTSLKEDSYRHNAEVQYNYAWEKLNLVIGSQYQKEHAYSNHTYLIDDKGPIILYQYGIYGQLMYNIRDTGIRLIYASRADKHSLFGINFLPKAGITYTKNYGTWRLTYGKGYLVPTLINTHQNTSGGIMLGNAEGFSLSDGSKIAPLMAETIQTLEMGYKDILINKKLYLDANAYFNWSENLISPLINIVPNGRSGGPVVTFRGDRPITDFTPGIAPGNLDPGALIMTTINFGHVQTYGFDIGLKYYFSDHYNLTLNYSYFNYNLDESDMDNDANFDGTVTANDLSINTPTNKLSSAFNLSHRKFYATLFARWIQEYDFFSGRNVAAKSNPDHIYNGYPVIEGKRVGDQWNYGPLGGFYLSANANCQLTRLLHLGVYANNILGKGNHEYVAMAPAQTTFGVELKFTIH